MRIGERAKKKHEPFLSFITDALLLNRKANACKMKPRGEDAGKRFPEQIRLRRTTMMMIMMKNMIGCLIFSAYFLFALFSAVFFCFLVVDFVLLVCLQGFFTVPKRSLRSKDAPAIQNIVQIEGKESFFFSSFFFVWFARYTFTLAAGYEIKVFLILIGPCGGLYSTVDGTVELFFWSRNLWPAQNS